MFTGPLAGKSKSLNLYLKYPIENENVSQLRLCVGRVVALDFDLTVLPQPAVVLQFDACRQAPVCDARLYDLSKLKLSRVF